MSLSKIEWTDRTWNPVRGCSRVSPGCENCYAEKIAVRFSESGMPFEGFASRETKRWTGKLALIPEKLREPLSWRKPSRVFVNSMSDLFHERLPDESIDQVVAVMAQAPQHTFQVLTKRAGRMRAYSAGLAAMARRARGIRMVRAMYADHPAGNVVLGAIERGEQQTGGMDWPLPNVWLGVSAENQQRADKRIPLLLQTPAAIRLVSYEPALGPVDFRAFMPPAVCECGHAELAHSAGHRTEGCQAGDGSEDNPICGCRKLRGERTHEMGDPYSRHPDGIDWVIVGGESGPGARPFDVTWAGAVVEQCREAGVPCFVKQIGSRPLGEPWAANHRLSPLSKDKRKGGEPADWPQSLRIREYPVERREG